MGQADLARLSMIALVTAFVYGCADGLLPTAPQTEPHFLVRSLGADEFDSPAGRVSRRRSMHVWTLRREERLKGDVTVEELIAPSGGRIRIQRAGLTVNFPAGAVSAPTLITVTAHAGHLVTYTFAPHGLLFNVPISIRQELESTEADDDQNMASRLQGAYLARGLDDIKPDGSADIAEFYPVQQLFEGWMMPATPSAVRFSVSHFSGYMLASGKADSTARKSP